MLGELARDFTPYPAAHTHRGRGLPPRAAHFSQQFASFEDLGFWKTIEDDYHWHIEILPVIGSKSRSYTFKEVYYSPVSSEAAVSTCARRALKAKARSPYDLGAQHHLGEICRQSRSPQEAK